MKIGTFVRTLNAIDHIDRFIGSHSFSDIICISDGGSTDGTLARIRDYTDQFRDRIKVRHFDKRIYLSDGEFYNHESLHYQFQFDWANEEGVDWLIADDVDHICNKNLQRDARQLLEANSTPYAYTLLMYVWGGFDSNEYFPELNKCCPMERLWAWKPKEWTPKINLSADKTVEIMNQPDALLTDASVIPHPPYALKHFSWLTEESTRKKMAFNAARGVRQDFPLDSCGKLEPLPDWAV